MAVRIAIVEDEKSAARALEQAIQRYGTENKVSFTIRVWHDPLLFLEEYQAEYDIVYMDIRMPALSGMETARNLRKMDRMVMLIFVTSLAQYALEGYTVGAFDYILKPVKYYDFALKLHWALEHLPEKQEATILLVSGGSKIRLRLRDLLYAETDGHYLIFHTAEGQIRQCGTISTLEADLTDKQFVRCNSCYLVNLQHIAGIKGYSLLLDNGEELKISQETGSADLQRVFSSALKKAGKSPAFFNESSFFPPFPGCSAGFPAGKRCPWRRFSSCRRIG